MLLPQIAPNIPGLEIAAFSRPTQIVGGDYFDFVEFILEGLASGCRIVATDLPGTKEILGNSDTDIITLVRTPHLRFIDRLYREDEYSFEQNLKKAVHQQIIAASKCAQIDLSPIQDKLDSFTWAGIFKKVRESYMSCL